MAYENAIPALRNTKEKYATDDEVCAGGSCRGTSYGLKLITILFSLLMRGMGGREGKRKGEEREGEGMRGDWRFTYCTLLLIITLD